MNMRIVLPWEKVRDAAVLAARGAFSRGEYYPKTILVLGDQRSLPGAVLYANALQRVYAMKHLARVVWSPAGEPVLKACAPDDMWKQNLNVFSMDGDDLREEGPLEDVLELASDEILEIRFGDDYKRFTPLVSRAVLFPAQEDQEMVKSGFISSGIIRDPDVVLSYPWESLS